ncbi:Hypothetical_protein [Hexamita inflata]|uniref:Hypothetical_protein n=1 Tax=Hexamita inflata TaxID=28002 RepID=A0AA86QSA1_9EUKA|nr:Hypothetical protein HINF_LOCUS51320 [Hexamita inflata]
MVHFIISSSTLKPRWFLQLIAWRRHNGRSGPYLISPDGRSGLFSRTSASCQNRKRRLTVRVSVTWDSRKQLSSSAFQVSLRLRRQMCSVFWNEDSRPILGPDRILSIQTDFGSIFGKRRGCLPGAARVYFAGLVFIIHTTALSQICTFLKTEGQAVFGFSIQTDSVFLQPPLNKQSRCFRLNSPQDASFKVFSSVRLIYARPKWKEPWLEKRQGTPLIQSVLETPRRYRASPGSGREFLNLVCLYVCRSLIQLHAPPKLLEQMAPRQAVACQRCHGAFHHFILNSKTKMVRSAQLARVETPQRTVLAPYLISPDGRSGRFLHRPAQAVKNQRRRRHCIFRVSVTWDSRKQLSSSAFQVSLRLRRQMCSVFWNEDSRPILGPDRILSIQTDFGSIFGKRRGCLPGAARVYFAGLVFIIHTTALSQICTFLKTEGQAVFGFSIQTDSVFLQPPLNKQSRCFRLNLPQDASFKVFSSVRLIYARPKWKEPWLEKRQGTPLIQSVLETPRRYRASPGSGREFLNLVCLYVCRSLIQLHAPPKLLEQMAPRQAVACQRCHGAFHHFILNSKTKMVRSAQLARVETPQRTVLAPYLISPDGRSGRFLHRPAQAVKNQRRRRHCIFRVSVTWDSRKQLSSSAFQVSLRLRRQMCSVFWNEDSRPILGPDRILSIQTDFGSIFGKRRGCLPGAARVYFAGLVFIIHTTALSQICILNRGQAVFGFSIQTDSVFLQPPLNKQSRCFWAEISHRTQTLKFSVPFDQFTQPQMKNQWLESGKEHTDPVCFGNAAKVWSEPQSGSSQIQSVYTCAAV